MNPTQFSINSDESDHDNGHHNSDEQAFDISNLPRGRSWLLSGVYKYQGFWLPSNLLQNIVEFQRSFQAHDSDIIVASKPKTGTTWLKAIVFSIVNRARYTPQNTPLLASNPHELVPFLEITLYNGATGSTKSNQESKTTPDLSAMEPPRLLATHVPYSLLPESVARSKCRVVYVCRNPFDALVSFWHFSKQPHPDRNATWTLEDCVDTFCQGTDTFGPFWDHALGFWKESLERNDKVLFLMYEDMKRDPVLQVKKIAEFVGFPFSEAEEREGVIEQICEICSFRSLKDLQANIPEDCIPGFKNSSYYRKGEVGDWVNELSPTMVEKVEKVISEKTRGSGLTFNSAT